MRNFIKEISKKASGDQQENVVAEGLRILLSFELDTNSMAKVREDIDKTIDKLGYLQEVVRGYGG